MPTVKESRERAEKAARKQERERDRAQAMRDYEAEQQAVRARTERLRALRLAREAKDAAGKAPKRRANKDR